MRVGIVILPEFRWSEAAPRWRAAEEYGFDHAWTYDHIGWRNLVEGPWFDAVPTLTAAAMVTSTIRLGTLVASANFRHPVHFAREITALDDVSGGRFLLALGAGGLGYDEAVIGTPALSGPERVDRFLEFARLLDQVLTNERTDFHGRWYTAVDARSKPGCVQQPRVPFVVAANARRSIEVAAEIGQGWVTTGKKSDTQDAWWNTIRERCKRFSDALDRAGRGQDSVDRYLSLDAAPVFSLTSMGAFQDAVGHARQCGFTDVITHWPRPGGWYAGDEAILEDVAAHISDLHDA